VTTWNVQGTHSPLARNNRESVPDVTSWLPFASRSRSPPPGSRSVIAACYSSRSVSGRMTLALAPVSITTEYATILEAWRPSEAVIL